MHLTDRLNSIAEGVIRSTREEALDNFIIFRQQQLNRILSEYIEHYNNRRSHQSLNQDSPKGYQVKNSGTIHSKPVLDGLIRDYFRDTEVQM